MSDESKATPSTIIADRVIPILDQQLERWGKKSARRTLDRMETAAIVDLTRAVVSLRQVEIRLAESAAKSGKEPMENMTVEELQNRALALMAQQGLSVSDLKTFRVKQ